MISIRVNYIRKAVYFLAKLRDELFFSGMDFVSRVLCKVL